jgi:post-segregation antitoxin (ccd killing protein)
MSETSERRPQVVCETDQARRWLEENREAIASINAFIERHRLIAGRLRCRPTHAAVRP